MRPAPKPVVPWPQCSKPAGVVVKGGQGLHENPPTHDLITGSCQLDLAGALPEVVSRPLRRFNPGNRTASPLRSTNPSRNARESSYENLRSVPWKTGTRPVIFGTAAGGFTFAFVRRDVKSSTNWNDMTRTHIPAHPAGSS
jgi:hypothetical protein